MRFSDLVESYSDNLTNDINGILMNAKHLGQNQLDTAEVAKMLSGMGYSINVDSLSDALSGNPLVLSATTAVIQLGTDEDNPDESESKSAVDKMARKEADRSIRS